MYTFDPPTLIRQKNVVLDSPPEVRALRALVAAPFMPTTDVEWMLEQIFGSLTVKDLQLQELYAVADRMAFGDVLFGHNDLTPPERDDLAQKIIHAGASIAQRLTELRLYEGGFLPYEFRTRVNDGHLLLTSSPRAG